MNELSQFIGRFHPLLVHLPIGILLLALLFEVLSRKARHRDLQKSLPLVLLLGSVAAAFSCATGWSLSQNGDYEDDMASRHQWLGICVAVVSFSMYWLKIKHCPTAYLALSVLLLPGILLTGHWGIALTHGQDYLTKLASQESTETEPEETLSFPEIPDVELSPPPVEAIKALQKMGVVVLPLGKKEPFLSLNFVNAPVVNPAMRQPLERLKKNVVWLKLSGTALGDSTLAYFSGFENLTKLHLDRTAIGDSLLVFLQPFQRLVFLNLVGTKVTAQGVATLASLPNLQKLFLYQTRVRPEDLAALQARLPQTRIDLGGYSVPVLPTDTVLLPLTK